MASTNISNLLFPSSSPTFCPLLFLPTPNLPTPLSLSPTHPPHSSSTLLLPNPSFPLLFLAPDATPQPLPPHPPLNSSFLFRHFLLLTPLPQSSFSSSSSLFLISSPPPPRPPPHKRKIMPMDPLQNPSGLIPPSRSISFRHDVSNSWIMADEWIKFS
ncbi:uncharacterized protein LOC135223948 [Macrobrachium nipponense]|uniref:uncharacterized protein LOC135223948 n=1 Tax=Macrobrachium nipponense TaxID=159736 RepID=UPI0030C7E0B9